MPFKIAPIACSRTPKCSTRPYGPPRNNLLCRSGGRKLGSPSGVVLLDSARSAELVLDQPLVERLALGIGLSPAVVGLLPLLLSLRAALDQLAGVVDHLIGDDEGLVRIKAEHLLGGSDFFLTQCSAVGLTGALEVGSGPADDRLQADEGRLICY